MQAGKARLEGRKTGQIRQSGRQSKTDRQVGKNGKLTGRQVSTHGGQERQIGRQAGP
jgi:hypothetical protein